MLSPERKGRLTASDHGQALGFGYLSAPAHWRRWNGLEEPDDRAMERMAWGTAHEADAVMAFEAATGFIADRTCDDQLWTPYGDWSGCTTDGLVGDAAIVEAKCSSRSSPSEAWWIQVQSQLHFTQRKTGYLTIWTPEQSSVWMTTGDAGYWTTVEPLLKRYLEMLKGEKPPARWRKPKVTLDFKWERVA